MRFSYLVADYPELSEIEINPLLATVDGAIALDARAVVDQSLVGRQAPPFSHLAIRPYPQEYTRQATTTGGLQVTLRPIRPEDEPAWHQMLDACSPETIAMRFSGMVRHTHEFATGSASSTTTASSRSSLNSSPRTARGSSPASHGSSPPPTASEQSTQCS